MQTLGDGAPHGAPSELGLERRLEALEGAVQRLTDVAWRRLLDAHVPAGAPLAVIADPATLPFEALHERPIVVVSPETEGSAAVVARLEVQRIRGVRFVLVPEDASSDVEQDTHLAEHLGSHFRAIASEPDVGAVFEVSADTNLEAETRALAELIDGLGLSDPSTPILDWTSLELARLLPGRTFFRPVEPGAPRLPHLGNTIEVVLVDDPARLDEAERVAADAAMLVSADGAGGPIVVEMRRKRPASGSAPQPVLILVATDADDEWLGELTDAMAGRSGVEVRAGAEQLATAVENGAPIVVLAERGVLPLPRCIETAERLLAANPQVGGVAVKLFDAEGSLEAAGGAAFSDGSVEGIARGAPPSARWHEYVRPVAAAVGLVVLRTEAARQCATASSAEQSDLTGLSARLWSGGWELHYQPDAAAVRVLAPPSPAAALWPQAPHGLPARPNELDESSWRSLLANDAVGVVR